MAREASIVKILQPPAAWLGHVGQQTSPALATVGRPLQPIGRAAQYGAGLYRLATRWNWLSTFKQLADAADAFEALEMLEGDPKALAKYLSVEIRHCPARAFGARRLNHARITYLVRCVDNGMQGLRLRVRARKGSVEAWA